MAEEDSFSDVSSTVSDQVDLSDIVIPEDLPQEPIMKGFVYIIEDDEGKFYIGSTQKTLEKRFAGHRSQASKLHGVASKYYSARSRGWNGVTIRALLEMTSTRTDLFRVEGEHIKIHLKNPLCLNILQTGSYESRQERHAREWVQRNGKLVECDCGDFIVTGSIGSHLSRSRHAKRMALKLLAPAPLEIKDEEFVQCTQCDVKVRRCNLVFHVTTDKHIINVKIKATELPDLTNHCPPRAKPPTGAKSSKEYCLCPCGKVTIREYWKTCHLHSLGHRKNMIELQETRARQARGEQEPQASTQTKAQIRAQKSTEKTKCDCGVMISIRGLRTHQAKETHRARLRQLTSAAGAASGLVIAGEIGTTAPSDEEELDEDDVSGATSTPQIVVRRGYSQCECGIWVQIRGVGAHLRSESHAEQIAIKNGVAVPLKGDAKRLEMIKCACGKMIMRCDIVIHEKSKFHKSHPDQASQDPPVKLADLEIPVSLLKKGMLTIPAASPSGDPPE